MVIIRSKRIILRPLRKEDAEPVTEILKDKGIYKNTTLIPYPYKIRHARDWINSNLKQYKKNKAVDTFAIERDGKLIGAIGLSGIIKNHKAELGYWLGKEYRGRGIITEAVGLVTKYAFDKLKLKRVSANVFSWNEASKKVLKKNSYKFEGVLKKYYEKGGKSIDVHLFAKIK